MVADPNNLKRAVVLGAGPAGLSAAMALAESGEYEVHVYQMGWRAGGKCATGRDAGHFRARQNGSHYLFGCYHNSFSLVRRAHEVLSRSKEEQDRTQYGTFLGDFVARNLLVGAEGYQRKASSPKLDRGFWYRYLPQNMACPGEGGKFATPFDYAFMLLQLGAGTLIDIYAAIVSDDSDDERFEGCRIFVKLFPISPFETSVYSRVLRGLLQPIRFVFNLVASGIWWLVKAWLVLWAFLIPITATRFLLKRWTESSILLLDAMRELGRSAREMALRENKNASNGAQRLIILFELMLAGATGFLKDELWRAGSFERLDAVDLREWLARNGASEFAQESSLVRTWYDATISYEDGLEGQARCSAGVAVQAILRSLLSYKGAFAFQMRAEVGDSFVAPIVRALELLGVQFHFFHRVTELQVSSRTRDVERITLVQQIPNPPEQAQFLDVTYHVEGARKSRKGWPSVPQNVAISSSDFPLDSYYSTAAHDTLVLERGSDEGFDVVVCALPLGVVQDVIVDVEQGPLAQAPGMWAEMFGQVRSTESQAIRMWFNVTLEELGWAHEAPILSGSTWPHSTWEDNSQAVEVQNFPADAQPLTIATLFGPLATGGSNIRDPRHHAAQVAVTRLNAARFLGLIADSPEQPRRRPACELWPKIEKDNDIDWSKFIDLDGRTGADRFDFQLVSTNVGPSESYVLAWPGTLRYRARPDESGFRSLYLAGDWTRNGVEAGTVEGAVMSGLKAARAITGSKEPIVGGDDFDHGSVFA